MHDIDRCDRCQGAGRRVELRLGKPNGSSFGDPVDGPCFGCRGVGYLSPVRSLARALHRGNTLAWCMVHARDGDPLPDAWALGESPGPLLAVMRGYPYDTIADSYFHDDRPPTLDDVLEHAKARSRSEGR